MTDINLLEPIASAAVHVQGETIRVPFKLSGAPTPIWKQQLKLLMLDAEVALVDKQHVLWLTLTLNSAKEAHQAAVRFVTTCNERTGTLVEKRALLVNRVLEELDP